MGRVDESNYLLTNNDLDDLNEYVKNHIAPHLCIYPLPHSMLHLSPQNPFKNGDKVDKYANEVWYVGILNLYKVLIDKNIFRSILKWGEDENVIYQYTRDDGKVIDYPAWKVRKQICNPVNLSRAEIAHATPGFNGLFQMHSKDTMPLRTNAEFRNLLILKERKQVIIGYIKAVIDAQEQHAKADVSYDPVKLWEEALFTCYKEKYIDEINLYMKRFFVQEHRNLNFDLKQDTALEVNSWLQNVYITKEKKRLQDEEINVDAENKSTVDGDYPISYAYINYFLRNDLKLFFERFWQEYQTEREDNIKQCKTRLDRYQKNREVFDKIIEIARTKREDEFCLMLMEHGIPDADWFDMVIALAPYFLVDEDDFVDAADTKDGMDEGVEKACRKDLEEAEKKINLVPEELFPAFFKWLFYIKKPVDDIAYSEQASVEETDEPEYDEIENCDFKTLVEISVKHKVWEPHEKNNKYSMSKLQYIWIEDKDKPNGLTVIS